ncbi:HNH endonuclease [Photobacterium leiognathi]|uniref:HNH endonuclease n=1 Tax=Photobacterium leiognathi TaxID=553611 RepID=UPI00387E5CC4
MCFTCNVVSPKNHGHHIVLYSEDGDASIDNMITLCPHCHAEYHAGRLQIDIGRF